MSKVPVHYITPYEKGNLGAAYNRAVLSISEYGCTGVTGKDWVCLMDGDAMFLTSDWGEVIQQYIQKFGKEYSLLTCLTNRVFETSQLYSGKIDDNTDILHHKKIADEVAKRPLSVKPAANYISGFLMLFSVKTWDEAGGFNSGILGVDNNFHKKVEAIGGKVGIMQSLYMFHYYRLHKSTADTSHLK